VASVSNKLVILNKGARIEEKLNSLSSS